MSFDNLNLHPKILKALTEAGYTEPTQIQSKAIPKVTRGFDIRASAQTGTGKTAAFLLPALNLLTVDSRKPGNGPRVLILAPTRELAMQIESQAYKYSKYLRRAKSVCLVGGVPYPAQMRKLSRPYDILIATPGRLIDFIDRGKIKFSRLEMLVLDEADRMLDMGFLEPVEKIVAATPDTRQTLLFSATLQGSVVKLSERLLNNPMEIVVHSEGQKHENIEQKLHFVDNLGHKNRLLDHLLKQDGMGDSIIFTSTKRHAEQLVGELQDKGFKAAALHGDMNQRQRTRTIERLRDGKIKILVATDVAARGIDVQSITHVINFDLPQAAEDYVHRIGRTGRAGASGTAISFASDRDSGQLHRIQQFTGQKIDVIAIPGFEPRPRQEKRLGGGAGKRRPFSKSRRGFEGNKPFRKDFSSSDGRKPFRKDFDGSEGEGRKPFRKDFSNSEGRKPFRKDFSSSEGRKPFRKDFDGSEGNKSFRKDFKGGNRPFKAKNKRPEKRVFRAMKASA